MGGDAAAGAATMIVDTTTDKARTVRTTMLRMDALPNVNECVGEAQGSEARDHARDARLRRFAFRRDKARPELQHGLRVDLTHTTLGDAQDLTDLGQRESFVVVQREHDLLALGHAIDRLGEYLTHLFDLVRRHRAFGRVGNGVAETQRLASVATDGEHLVEGDEADERDLTQRRLELIVADTQLARELGIGRSAMELRLELGVGLLERPGLRPHRTRHPVDRTELVEDRALDA